MSTFTFTLTVEHEPWPLDCGRCEVFIAPWSPDDWPTTSQGMTHIRPGGGPDWEQNEDHGPEPDLIKWHNSLMQEEQRQLIAHQRARISLLGGAR